MPTRPPRYCIYPGCAETTTKGCYCDAHRSAVRRSYNQYHRDPDSAARYDRNWRQIRDLYIDKHPLCERCLDAGRYRPAEEVHHIRPLADGGDNSDDNLMSLCKSCHSRITLASTRG